MRKLPFWRLFHGNLKCISDAKTSLRMQEFGIISVFISWVWGVGGTVSLSPPPIQPCNSKWWEENNIEVYLHKQALKVEDVWLSYTWPEWSSKNTKIPLKKPTIHGIAMWAALIEDTRAGLLSCSGPHSRVLLWHFKVFCVNKWEQYPQSHSHLPEKHALP